MTYPTGYTIPQSYPPLPPRATLPTMYDLPSEWPKEPGLPGVGTSPSRDVFHDLQPQLLSQTLTLASYSHDQWFAASDLNLYYDVHHPLWHKRPDWFLSIGVPRLYDQRDLRRSYVTWQEGQNSHIIIEFLSSGTETEDLGRFHRSLEPDSANIDTPPGKLIVYEQYLRVPHYLTYDRKTQHLRYFQLVGGQYREQPPAQSPPQVWLSDLQIGLGLWHGSFDDVPGTWLRWCDAQGQWLLSKAERLAERLRQLGVDPMVPRDRSLTIAPRLQFWPAPCPRVWPMMNRINSSWLAIGP